MTPGSTLALVAVVGGERRGLATVRVEGEAGLVEDALVTAYGLRPVEGGHAVTARAVAVGGRRAVVVLGTLHERGALVALAARAGVTAGDFEVRLEVTR